MCIQRVLTHQYSIYLILSTVFHVINLTRAMKSYLYYLIDLILSNLVSSLYLFNQIMHHLSIYIYLPTHRSIHLFIETLLPSKKRPFSHVDLDILRRPSFKVPRCFQFVQRTAFFAPVDGGAADTFAENFYSCHFFLC